MIWRESVSFGVFWVNVSERYLNVCRILLDHHRALFASSPFLCHIYGVEGSEIGCSYIGVAVVEEIHCHDIYAEVVI